VTRGPVEPVWVGELEIVGEPRLRAVVDGLDDRYGRARALVRLHGVPLGFVSVALDRGVAAAPDALATVGGDLLRAACTELAAPIEAHLGRDGVVDDGTLAARLLRAGDASCAESPASSEEPPVSVVVCTRDRPEQLEACLGRLADLRYGTFDVLVVDNAPRDDRTESLVGKLAAADDRLRYVVEPRPGLSHARNRGLAEATFDLVAFTDDDVLVDEGWLRGLAAGHGRAPDVVCVTGMIASAALSSRPEQYFDRHARWAAVTEPRLFELRQRWPQAPSYPFSPAIFGAGANFALDRRAALEIGGFDVLLGAGAPAGGAEDIDMFVRLLFAGGRIAYEPSALVWHAHRTGQRELSRQLYSWGTGLSAYLTKCVADPATRPLVRRRVVPSLVHLARLWRRAASAGTLSAGEAPFALPEVAGFLVGPVLYLRSRRATSRLSEAYAGSDVRGVGERLRPLAVRAAEALVALPLVDRVLPVLARPLWLPGFRRDLQRLHDALAASELAGRYWLWGGLLLSWARDGGPLHYTDDVDFALRLEDRERLYEAVSHLEAAGFRRHALYRNNAGEICELVFERRGVRYEFFVLEATGDELVYYTHGWPRSDPPVELEGRIPRQELVEFDFMGRRWLKAADHERELDVIYGDWRTPDPDWYFTDDHAVQLTTPWVEAVTEWTSSTPLG